MKNALDDKWILIDKRMIWIRLINSEVVFKETVTDISGAQSDE